MTWAQNRKLQQAKEWMKSRGIESPRVKLGQAYERYQKAQMGRDAEQLQRVLLTKEKSK